MTDIKKYSKEWFAINGSDGQKEALQKLKSHYCNKDLDTSVFDSSVINGSKDEVREKLLQEEIMQKK